MELEEPEQTPPTNPLPKASVELNFNLFNGLTGEQLNSEPLSEEAARKLASTLHESDAGLPLVIRSIRAILMG